jgi:sulfite exporter TauE/SafE
MSVLASSPLISFCVALGKAHCAGMCQGLLFWKYSALGNFVMYSLMRPRRLFLRSMTQASFSVSIPSWS